MKPIVMEKLFLQYLTVLSFSLLLASACTQTAEEEQQAAVQAPEALPDSVYLSKGGEVVQKTFATLSSHLKANLQKKGVEGAVAYCHLNAYPLVDSLSRAYGAQIRRTSLKVRNPQDAPDAYEQKALAKAAAAHEKGERISPWIERLPAENSAQGEVAYYAPIYTLPLCLKCHGTPGETLAESDYAIIKKYYPDDQAIGYQAGDWRGLWSIRFKE